MQKPHIFPLPPMSFGNQLGGNAGNTGSVVGSADENMRRLMEMLKKFNPKQYGAPGFAQINAGPLPGTEGA